MTKPTLFQADWELIQDHRDDLREKYQRMKNTKKAERLMIIDDILGYMLQKFAIVDEKD